MLFPFVWTEPTIHMSPRHLTDKRYNPLNYSCYSSPVFFFILTGLASCLYLSIVHYRNYVAVDFASICAISKSINCDTVAQSHYSVLFSLPVAVWGILVFIFLGFFSVNTWGQKRMGVWWASFALGLICCSGSMYFGYIAARKIHSYCVFCLLCYLCFFSITFLSFIIIRRFRIPFHSLRQSGRLVFASRINQIFLAIFFTTLPSLLLFYPHYWEFPQQSTPNTVSTGKTQDGSPWIGANQPKIIIDEYSDYMCFQCSKMHVFLRALVAKHSESVRLVHRNFPLDNMVNPLVKKPFHVGAGYMALLAIYANSQDKFWEMNDELYRLTRISKEEGDIDLHILANRTGLSADNLSRVMSSPEYQQVLLKEIQQGLKYKIIATPSYVINGEVYTGTIPPQVFQELNQ